MFVPEINFLKDQPNRPAGEAGGYVAPAQTDFNESTGGIEPLLIGIAVPVLALAAVGGITLFFNSQVSARESTSADLAGQVSQLNGQLAEIATIKKDLESERQRVEAVVNLFDLSRPWSAVMEDLRRRVPQGVWLNSLAASNSKEGDFVQLDGKALRFEDVAAFQLTLKDSPFVSDATVQDTTKEESKDGSPTTISYKIKVQLSGRKLRELVTALESTGSVGLLEKLRRVQQEKLVR